jgi:hypothetical protein
MLEEHRRDPKQRGAVLQIVLDRDPLQEGKALRGGFARRRKRFTGFKPVYCRP